MSSSGQPDAQSTEELILQVLVDEHRQQAQFDPEADPDAILSFETSVAEWREACDLVGWRKLGRALNAAWRINASDADWRTVLEPARKRMLLDVCRFLAQRAEVPMLAPRGAFGAACRAAGAFFGIRAELASAGIDARRIRPCSELAPYLRRAPWAFVSFAARTAPGRLPYVYVRAPLHVRCVGIFFLGWLGSAIAVACGFRQLALVLAGVGIVGWICTNLAARLALPYVSLGALHTFADYARCLAGAPVTPADREERDGGFRAAP